MTINLTLSLEEAAILSRAVEAEARLRIKDVTEDSAPPLDLKVASRELKVLNDIGIELDQQIENYHDLNRQPHG